MKDGLSLRANDEEIEINANRADYLAALVRGIVGAAPGIGQMASELITSQIPNQKLDRVILFIKVLEDKLKYVQEDVLKQKFKSEEFSDLLEDALAQATRTLTEERREYIANLLKNGLTDEELDHIAKKRLLFLLNELNDAEIVILCYFSLDDEIEREKMRQKYPFVPKISAVDIDVDKPPSEDPNQILYEQYQGQLSSLSLIYVPGKDYHTTVLANLLLRYIGVIGN